MFIYEMPASRLAASLTLQSLKLKVPDGVRRPAVAAVRPRCLAGIGELRFVALK
ncbi:MAG: hypothetical protein ACKVQA_03590 [Burkholderiales bacterium]